MISFVLRALLLAAGLVFALSLLLAALVLLTFWGLRWGLSALWARLTGRPVQPLVMPFVVRRWQRMDPREGFGGLWPGRTPLRAGRRAGEAADVTDVQARPVPPASSSPPPSSSPPSPHAPQSLHSAGREGGGTSPPGPGAGEGH